jgi:hypothetical protein
MRGVYARKTCMPEKRALARQRTYASEQGLVYTIRTQIHSQARCDTAVPLAE